MLNAPTLEQLQALRLTTMATAWTEQQQQAEMTALAFDERFALLVDASGARGRTSASPAPCRTPSSNSRRRASRRSTTPRGASSTKPSSANLPPAAGSPNTKASSSPA